MKKTWVWIAAGLAGVAIAGLGLVLHGSGLGGAYRELELELAAARAEGIPTEPSDLVPEHPVLPSRNAAGYYQRAYELAAAAPASAVKILDDYHLIQIGSKKGSIPLSTLRKAVADLEPALAAFTLGSQQERLHVERDYSLGPLVEYPEFRWHRTILRALAYKASLQFEDGDIDQAEASLTAAARSLRHLGQEPTTTPLLMRARGEEPLIQALHRLLELKGRNPAVQAMVARTLQALGPIPDLRFSVGTELPLWRAFFRIYEQNPDALGPCFAPPEVTRLKSVLALNEAACVNELRIMVQHLPESERDLLKSARALDEYQEGPEETESSGPALFRLKNSLATLLPYMYATSGPVRTTMKMVALRNITWAALDVLAGNPKPVRLDPYTGQNVKVDQRRDRVVVYSVGPDEVDDQGREKEYGATAPKTFDLTVRIPSLNGADN
jgi:hypothetical protein